MIYIIDSFVQLREFAEKVKEQISPGSLVFLSGSLGAGKTTFVKQFANLCGIETVASPTFTLINEYHGECSIAHADFYRLKDKSELQEIGLFEYLHDEEYIVFIEWAELFSEPLPKPDLVINFSFNEKDQRTAEINS